MTVFHSINSLARSSGGPSRSVSQLAFAQMQLGQSVEVLVWDGNQDRVDLADKLSVQFGIKSRQQLAKLWSGEDAASAHLVHDHAVWLMNNRKVASVSRKLGVKRIVSPRGMLEPWALNHKKWKKRLAWLLYQKRDLQTADCLHATAEAEAEQFRRLGLKNPIAVIPNGVVLPEEWLQETGIIGQGSEDGGRGTEDGGRVRTILFLSRIQKKKGLLNLVKAWARVRQPGWRIQIVGPEEDGHLKEVKQAADQAGVLEDFSFEGPVKDRDKWDLYREADVFVLPTFSENFGLVIAEALACGLPVITTKGAPWKELETHACGWWIDIGVEPLAVVLNQAIGLSDAERTGMGNRGRQLVESNYAWPSLAARMVTVYQWMLHGGKRPDCVWAD